MNRSKVEIQGDGCREPGSLHVPRGNGCTRADLSIYLSTQQCDRANDARERVELAREKSASAITRVGYDKIQPNSEMDDTYFFPEPELADTSVEAG